MNHICKITLTLAAAFTVSIGALAATPAIDTEISENAAVETSDTFRQLEYKGFEFEIPRDSRVAIDRNLVARHPDGSFGVSMMVEEAIGTTQKRAVDLCRGIAGQLKLRDAEVSKIKVNGINGAIAKGKINDQDVAVLLLPYNGKEMTAVIMADKEHKDWSDRYMRTLRKK